jgi:hypothetical protein
VIVEQRGRDQDGRPHWCDGRADHRRCGVDGKTYTCTVTAGQSYTFKLAAKNPVGTSTLSAASNAVTPT